MGACSSKDMAICLVIFNPAKTKKIIANYFAMIKELKDYPVFTLELVYEGRNPEIPGAFHIIGNSVMFSKENLYRILETKIPYKYKKLAFLDTDILFSDSSWYSKASKLLDTHDVLQLFDECNWLGPENKETTLIRKSVLHMKEIEYMWTYHPGFAWAMRRDWYNKIGFFDWAVSGSGDTLSVIGWLKKGFPKNFKSCPKSIQNEFSKFYSKPSPRITYLKDVCVTHLYHGSRINRQYVSRHEMINIPEDITKLIKVNSDGLYEWVEIFKWNHLFLNYFKSRNDDDDVLELDTDTVLTS